MNAPSKKFHENSVIVALINAHGQTYGRTGTTTDLQKRLKWQHKKFDLQEAGFIGISFLYWLIRTRILHALPEDEVSKTSRFSRVPITCGTVTLTENTQECPDVSHTRHNCCN